MDADAEKLDKLAIYLTTFAHQVGPKMLHDETVNTVGPLLESARLKTAEHCFAIAETRADRNIFAYLEELKYPTSLPKLDVSERHTQNLGGRDEVKDNKE